MRPSIFTMAHTWHCITFQANRGEGAGRQTFSPFSPSPNNNWCNHTGLSAIAAVWAHVSFSHSLMSQALFLAPASLFAIISHKLTALPHVPLVFPMGHMQLAHKMVFRGVSPFVGCKPRLPLISPCLNKMGRCCCRDPFLRESSAAWRVCITASAIIASERASPSDLRYAVSLTEPNNSRIQLSLTFMVFRT